MRNIIATELRSAVDPALSETGIAYDQITVEMAVDTGPVTPVSATAEDWLEVGYGVYRLRLPDILPALHREKTVVVVVTADGCLPARQSLTIKPVLR